jgi:hypothetical protein
VPSRESTRIIPASAFSSGAMLRGRRPNVLAFAFDGLDRRFGRSHCFFGAVLVFEDRRMLVVGGIEFVEPRQFGVGQRRRLGRKPTSPSTRSWLA